MAPKYKLTYMNMMGLAEPIRFLLEYGKADWEDVRIEKGPLVEQIGPFGKVPVLEVDGKKLHQSLAITRYLAKQFKLAGDSDWEAVQIDMITETFSDMMSQLISAGPIVHGSDKEASEKKKIELANETLPFFYSRFDEIVKNNSGHFVNGKLTWADFTWAHFSVIPKGFLGLEVKGDYPNLKAVQDTVFQLPAIKAWLAKRPVTGH